MPPPAPDPAAYLLEQFLAWVADRPRGYAETMEAWRTSCPRLPVWEEATAGRLVRLGEDRAGSTVVLLTEAGRERLAGAASVAAEAAAR
ncbi:hypothetical protein EAH89_08845 [Roseomonas nepalensis]|uniref:Uncharacterized protein n=1 Tax=Muricoccus nepalensis TaxID=1854500 RepID=A0A502G8H8_9PROT|nr:hypothetical protein [Roseomonas nepalensis]TPG58064.1 hypothetical protein EAH89_08845 [Roseomonas nepalensis]